MGILADIMSKLRGKSEPRAGYDASAVPGKSALKGSSDPHVDPLAAPDAKARFSEKKVGFSQTAPKVMDYKVDTLTGRHAPRENVGSSKKERTDALRAWENDSSTQGKTSTPAKEVSRLRERTLQGFRSTYTNIPSTEKLQNLKEANPSQDLSSGRRANRYAAIEKYDAETKKEAKNQAPPEAPKDPPKPN